MFATYHLGFVELPFPKPCKIQYIYRIDIHTTFVSPCHSPTTSFNETNFGGGALWCSTDLGRSVQVRSPRGRWPSPPLQYLVCSSTRCWPGKRTESVWSSASTTTASRGRQNHPHSQTLNRPPTAPPLPPPAPPHPKARPGPKPPSTAFPIPGFCSSRASRALIDTACPASIPHFYIGKYTYREDNQKLRNPLFST